MKKPDPVKSLMFKSLAKAKLLSPEEEVVLANNCREAKMDVWRDILQSPKLAPEIISFLYANIPSRNLNKLNHDIIETMMQRAVSVKRSRSGYRLSKWGEAKESAIIEISSKDPCLKVGAGIIKAAQSGDIQTEEDWLGVVENSYQKFVELRNTFIEKNMRLVITATKRFYGINVPVEDIVQEGVFGLQKAVDMFDPSLGFKFSTYSMWWIRATMHRYCRDRGKVIRVPIHMQEMYEKYLSITKGRKDLCDEELSEMLCISKNKLHKIKMMSVYDCVSLEAPIAESPDIELVEALSDGKDHFKRINELMDMRLVNDILEHFPEREKYVLEKRFGLNGSDEMTLQEIANNFGISRERVRQIQNNALNNLRRSL